MGSLIVSIEVYDREQAKREGVPAKPLYSVKGTEPFQWKVAVLLLRSVANVLERRTPEEGNDQDGVTSEDRLTQGTHREGHGSGHQGDSDAGR